MLYPLHTVTYSHVSRARYPAIHREWFQCGRTGWDPFHPILWSWGSPVTSLLCDLGQTRRQPTLETLTDSLERLQGTAVVGNCAASRDPGTSASCTKSALHRSLGFSLLIYHSCLLIHKEQTGSPLWWGLGVPGKQGSLPEDRIPVLLALLCPLFGVQA